MTKEEISEGLVKKLSNCPNCKKRTLECFYLGDVGGIDYYDRYKAKCLSCDYEKIEDIYGGSPIAANFITSCPFCNIHYDEHL